MEKVQTEATDKLFADNMAYAKPMCKRKYETIVVGPVGLNHEWLEYNVGE